MRIGYARVSTEEQKMDLQRAGCDKIFTDHGASGGSFERERLEAARQKGQHLGRRPSLSADQVDKAIQAIEREDQYIVDVAERFDVSRRSLTRLIKARRASL